MVVTTGLRDVISLSIRNNELELSELVKIPRSDSWQ